jgi:hypothetical protein
MYHINPNKVQPSFVPMDHNKTTFSKKQNVEEWPHKGVELFNTKYNRGSNPPPAIFSLTN